MVTITSQIASIVQDLPSAGRATGVGPGALNAIEALGPFRQPLHRDAPVERFILAVTLAELPGDLGMRELDAEVERVARVVVDTCSCG